MQLLLFAGLFASVLGGMAIGLAYMVAGLLACTASDLALAPPQWKLILVAGVGGLLGSLIDSLIGKAVTWPSLRPSGSSFWWPALAAYWAAS